MSWLSFCFVVCVLLHNTWIINECLSQINPTAHFVQQQNSSLSTSWTALFASFSLMFFHLSSRTFVKECAHVNIGDVREIWTAELWTRRSLCAECTVGVCMRVLRVGCVCVCVCCCLAGTSHRVTGSCLAFRMKRDEAGWLREWRSHSGSSSSNHREGRQPDSFP